MLIFNRLIPLLLILAGVIEVPDIGGIGEIVFAPFTIYSDNFGPYVAYQDDSEVTVKVQITKGHKYKEQFLCGPNKDDLRYAYNTVNHVEQKDYDFTFTLPTSSYLSSSGMYCKITIFDETSNKQLIKEFTIKPVDKAIDINPSLYKKGYKQFNNTSYYFDKTKGFIVNNERYRFPNYIDYLNSDTYHRLDLSGVDFNYSGNDTFLYQNASIKIPDYHNIFPNIPHVNNYITIPLKIYKSGSLYKMNYLHEMYVHPKTLMMSFISRSGFVKTRYFYMPVNKKEEMLDEVVDITINKCGLTKNNISWHLSYLANQNLIGKCSNSDYCIVEGE